MLRTYSFKLIHLNVKHSFSFPYAIKKSLAQIIMLSLIFTVVYSVHTESVQAKPLQLPLQQSATQTATTQTQTSTTQTSTTQKKSPHPQQLKAQSRHSSAYGKNLLHKLSQLDFSALGHPATRWDSIPPVYADRQNPHQLLVVLVEFKDLGFERFAQDSQQSQKLQSYYQEYLFDPTYKRVNTLSHYYHTQSLGKYHLQGKVLPPIQLDHNKAYYGRPKRDAGGDWRNDSKVEDLVEEVLKKIGKIHSDLNWKDFDRWDPKDYDQDGILDEADGYLDHLVIVYAGGGQSSCQSLYKLHLKLNPNVGVEALQKLNPQELACADRIWPHRFMIQRREDEGPSLTAFSNHYTNHLGGAPILPTLWAKDYNMQSEYTEIATFIHEFGHSIGLPDIYARATNNSTGQWEVMSHTASPSPQSLSAWSRMVLGWLTPRIVLPPEVGGQTSVQIPLKVLDDPRTDRTSSRSILVALPPQPKTIELTSLSAQQGSHALYSGQGNELNRSVQIKLSLPTLLPTVQATKKIMMDMQAWWEIEPGWDFAYVEVKSTRKGSTWQRIVDRKNMHAKHGHDGLKSLPGFTGYSGDLDGDGKNESHAQCDPKQKLKHGEDKKGRSACQKGTWVPARFDLSAWQGQEIIVRVRYFTDMAAVEKGILIDQVKVSIYREHQGKWTALESIWSENFDTDTLSAQVKLKGFLKSQGKHEFEVPHFYMIEYRDPYTDIDHTYRYDQTLSKTRPIFYFDPHTQSMKAVTVHSGAGALIWYANGAYAWSENEPTQNGPGKGFLLAVDAHPQELKIKGWEHYYKGDVGQFNTHYKLPSDSQSLRQATLKTICAVRSHSYLPPDLPKELWDTCATPLTSHIHYQGKQTKFSYEIVNELLPGEARKPYIAVSELYDYKKVKGKWKWGFRNRLLRSIHLKDAPFNLDTQTTLTFYDIHQGALKKVAESSRASETSFDDLQKQRWQNPHLRFGGVHVPPFGLKVTFTPPSEDEKKHMATWVHIQWR